MGRGRAKAKQTKVARELKYNTGNPDLDALQAELAGSPSAVDDDIETDHVTDDPYAKYYGDEEDDTED